MRWLFRKQRKKVEDDIGDLEFKEPKKSILRTNDRKQQQQQQQSWQDVTGKGMTEFSLVDLRNATIGGSRFLESDCELPNLHSSHSLRSLDSTRDSERVKRNVLFLDEVLSRKKQLSQTAQSVGSPTSLRTNSSTGTPYFTFASYPVSYQPSPVLQKRDLDNGGIELISRSPLPRAKTQSDSNSDIWSPGSPTKDILRNLSLSRRRRQEGKKPILTDSFYEDPYESDATNGSGTSHSTLFRFNSGWGTVAGIAGRSIVPMNGGSGRTTEGTIPNGSMESSPTYGVHSSSVPSSSPAIKRPAYPKIIEPRILTPANSDNHINRTAPTLTATSLVTDSTATLRPDRASSGSLETLINASRRATPIASRDQGFEMATRTAGRSTPNSPILRRHVLAKQSEKGVTGVDTYHTITVNGPYYKTFQVPLTRKPLTEKPPLPQSSTQHNASPRTVIRSKPPRIVTVSAPANRAGSEKTRNTTVLPQTTRVISISRPSR